DGEGWVTTRRRGWTPHPYPTSPRRLQHQARVSFPHRGARPPSLLREGILRASQAEPHRDRAEPEVLADRVDQVALVARRQGIEARPEYYEARRTSLDLGDIAQLDPLPSRCRRRVGFHRLVEPAIERCGRPARKRVV